MNTRNSFVKQILSRAALLGLPLAVVAGCTAFPSLFPVANQHPANWVQDHGKHVRLNGGYQVATVDNGMTCTTCHTATKDASGSIAPGKGATSNCFQCHEGGPTGTPHLAGWKAEHGFYTTKAGGYKVAQVNGKSCSVCHTTEKTADGKIPPSPVGTTTCFRCHGGPDPYAN